MEGIQGKKKGKHITIKVKHQNILYLRALTLVFLWFWLVIW